jgi:hypothetical protein
MQQFEDSYYYEYTRIWILESTGVITISFNDDIVADMWCSIPMV